MAVGEKYPFLQFSNSVKSTVVGGATFTFSTGAQPDPEVRVQNLSTAAIWVGMGTRSTSSAAVTGNGVRIEKATDPGSIQIFRAGGNTTIAAFTENATHTLPILITGGEGL